MTLKTLKDLDILEIPSQSIHSLYPWKVVRILEIRAEAIKWVKSPVNPSVQGWIIDFFNITPEELK